MGITMRHIKSSSGGPSPGANFIKKCSEKNPKSTYESGIIMSCDFLSISDRSVFCRIVTTPLIKNFV